MAVDEGFRSSETGLVLCTTSLVTITPENTGGVSRLKAPTVEPPTVKTGPIPPVAGGVVAEVAGG